jgi:PD-(D/E)XK nuclease superfamily
MKPVTWSYSSLGLFQQCPRKYYHLRVIKDIQEPETEAIMFGKEVHKAAEDYIGQGVPIPAKYKFIEPVLKILENIQGEKLVEYKMGLTKKLEACDFFDKNVWFRGVADLLIIDEDSAHVIDYKTGKSSRYADTKQLELMALAIFKHFPQVQKVKAGLAFVVCDDFIKAKYTVEDAPLFWMRWIEETNRLESAHKTGVWNPKPNFTCKNFCKVLTCEHNGKGSYR